MLCPYCGKEIAEEEKVCPECGKALPQAEAIAADLAVQEAQEVQEVQEAQEAAAQEPALPAPYVTQAPEKVCELPEVPQVKHGHSEVGRDVFFTVVILALVALLMWGVYKVIHEPEPTPADGATVMQPVTDLARNRGKTGRKVAGADNIVAETDDIQLTNQEFIYFYWDSFYSLYSSYGDYLSMYLDFNVPFDQQSFSPTQTWNEYFTDTAFESWIQMKTLCAEAQVAGYTLSEEDQAYVDSTIPTLEGYAASSGYASTDAYLQNLFDPSSDAESYAAYIADSVLASSYASSRYDAIYEEVADPNAKGQNCVNVRHILIQPQEGTDIPDDAAARAKAEEVLAMWLQNPTAEYFAQLAETYSTDDGSNTNGGLYEDVRPGMMVTAFNDWCFDPLRQVGDSGIVLTDYGYHVMYLDSFSDTVYGDPNETAAQEAYTQWLEELFGGLEYQTHPEKIVFTRKTK